MAITTNVQCPVEVVEGASFGEYANAIRIIPDSGNDVLMDFCVYSAQDNKARVVARVRLATSMLRVIRDRITSDLEPGEEIPPNTIFLMPALTGDN
jgi:hypothetical protein